MQVHDHPDVHWVLTGTVTETAVDDVGQQHGTFSESYSGHHVGQG